jgi:hypothetical protein
MVSSEFRNNAIRFAERRSMRDIKYLGWCGVVCRHNHSPTSAMPLPPRKFSRAAPALSRAQRRASPRGASTSSYQRAMFGIPPKSTP